VKQSHADYGRARQAVLDAQAAVAAAPARPDEPSSLEARALAAALEQLRIAEASVADELEVAWQANLDAVQAALATQRAALLDQARVETECGHAARQRHPRRPVLNDAEVARIGEARAAVTAARAAVAEAKARFKAGVTTDQLVTAAG
jgi:hypothetical protein